MESLNLERLIPRIYMNPLKVALIHRDSVRLMSKRMVGIWSYDVPQFEVEHFPMADGFEVSRSDFADAFDLIWYEDAKLQGTIKKDALIPVAYYIVDSSLSRVHFEMRLAQARLNADIAFVDWDRLRKFSSLEIPVRRLSHCVNDVMYQDYCGFTKSIDVGIFQGETKERLELNDWVSGFCGDNGLSCEIGVRHHECYAKAMARCKIVINLNRDPSIRPHRIFDAMACRTCLFTDKLPNVSGEKIYDNAYVEYNGFDDLGRKLVEYLDTGKWKFTANVGYNYVTYNHTWKVRAPQLMKKLAGLLKRVKQ